MAEPVLPLNLKAVHQLPAFPAAESYMRSLHSSPANLLKVPKKKAVADHLIRETCSEPEMHLPTGSTLSKHVVIHHSDADNADPGNADGTPPLSTPQEANSLPKKTIIRRSTGKIKPPSERRSVKFEEAISEPGEKALILHADRAIGYEQPARLQKPRFHPSKHLTVLYPRPHKLMQDLLPRTTGATCDETEKMNADPVVQSPMRSQEETFHPMRMKTVRHADTRTIEKKDASSQTDPVVIFIGNIDMMADKFKQLGGSNRHFVFDGNDVLIEVWKNNEQPKQVVPSLHELDDDVICLDACPRPEAVNAQSDVISIGADERPRQGPDEEKERSDSAKSQWQGLNERQEHRRNRVEWHDLTDEHSQSPDDIQSIDRSVPEEREQSSVGRTYQEQFGGRGLDEAWRQPECERETQWQDRCRRQWQDEEQIESRWRNAKARQWPDRNAVQWIDPNEMQWNPLNNEQYQGPGEVECVDRILNEAPCQEPIIVPCQEPIMVPCQDPIMVPCQDPIMVPCQDPIMVPCQEPIMVPCQDPIMVPCQEPIMVPCQEPIMVPCQDPIMVPCQEPIMVPCQEQSCQGHDVVLCPDQNDVLCQDRNVPFCQELIEIHEDNSQHQIEVQCLDHNEVQCLDQNEVQCLDQNEVQCLDQNEVQCLDQNEVQCLDQNEVQYLDQNEVQCLDQSDARCLNQNDVQMKESDEMQYQNVTKSEPSIEIQHWSQSFEQWQGQSKKQSDGPNKTQRQDTSDQMLQDPNESQGKCQSLTISEDPIQSQSLTISEDPIQSQDKDRSVRKRKNKSESHDEDESVRKRQNQWDKSQDKSLSVRKRRDKSESQDKDQSVRKQQGKSEDKSHSARKRQDKSESEDKSQERSQSVGKLQDQNVSVGMDQNVGKCHDPNNTRDMDDKDQSLIKLEDSSTKPEYHLSVSEEQDPVGCKRQGHKEKKGRSQNKERGHCVKSRGEKTHLKRGGRGGTKPYTELRENNSTKKRTPLKFSSDADDANRSMLTLFQDCLGCGEGKMDQRDGVQGNVFRKSGADVLKPSSREAIRLSTDWDEGAFRDLSDSGALYRELSKSLFVVKKRRVRQRSVTTRVR